MCKESAPVSIQAKSATKDCVFVLEIEPDMCVYTCLPLYTFTPLFYLVAASVSMHVCVNTTKLIVTT